ncbi:Rhs element Vgr protein [Burkholderia sp. YI23]|nr:Rhs element Vgr protein [Burkholderia sp. YI23]
MSSVLDDGSRLVASGGAMPGRQAYHLEVPSQEALAGEFSVVSWEVKERMGQPVVAKLCVTHPRKVSRRHFLSRDAAFIMTPLGEKSRRFSGYIASYATIKTTADFTSYEITLVSHLGRLDVVNSKIYQHKTTPEIIESILLSHGIPAHLISIRLRANYQQHAFRFQYQQTDLAYVQMLCQKAGIYLYVIETEHGDQIVLGDDVDHYVHDAKLVLPFREPSGLNAAAESVYELVAKATTVPKSIVVAEYNPERAYERYKGEENIAPQDDTTYGSPYIYGTNHEDQKGARLQAQLRHEAEIAWQIVYEGESTARELHVARVFGMDEEVDDAPDGLLIFEITHRGARDQSYTNSFKAIPADRRFRLKFEDCTWPKISGSLSARVTSPDKYKYAYLTAAGYYTVRFDLDFADWPNGGESVPLRMAKPFAGKLQTGMHFPALDNDEAVIEFRDGDPDKPYIAAFQHHSQAVDLVTSERRWLSRNEIRTQSNNKLRMEDWAGQEGIKLSTEHSGKSQLNLGYLVDNKLARRGEGFELRTSAQGAVRAGGGLFISSNDRPNATGAQLDMREALQQLGAAQSQMRMLAQAAQAAQADAADAKAMNDVLQNQIKDLQQAVMVLSASASIAITSPETIQHSAGSNLTLTSGENVDVGAMRKFTLAAGELISFFAGKMGIKLFASKGKVDIQAQSDELALAALKDVTVTSTSGKLILTAKNEVWIGAGGSYIKINGNRIENGTAGDIIEKCASWDIDSSTSSTRTAALPVAQDCEIPRQNAASRHEALVPLDA